MEIIALQASRENTAIFMSGREGGMRRRRRKKGRGWENVYHSTCGKGGSQNVLQLFCVHFRVPGGAVDCKLAGSTAEISRFGVEEIAGVERRFGLSMG